MGSRWGAVTAALAAAVAAALVGGAPASATAESGTTTAGPSGRLMTVYGHPVFENDALGTAAVGADDRVALRFEELRVLRGRYQQIDAAEVLTDGRGSAVLLLGTRATASGFEQTWAMLEHRGPGAAPAVLRSGVFARGYVSATMLEHEGRGYVVLIGGAGDRVGDGYYSLMAVDARTGALSLASTGILPGWNGVDVTDLGDGEALMLLWRFTPGGDDSYTDNSLQRWQIEGSGTAAELVRTAGARLNSVYWGVERVETDGDRATREVILDGEGAYSVVRFGEQGGPSLLGQGNWPYSQDFPDVHALGNPEDGVHPLVVGSGLSPYARGLAVTGPAEFRAGIASWAPMYDAAWVVDPTS